MRQELRLTGWVSGLLVALFAVILVSAAMGPVRIDPLIVAKILLQHALVVPTGLSMHMETAAIPLANAGLPWPNFDISTRQLLSFSVPKTSETIVFKLRLPRILLGAVVGFALAAAGTVMQGFFRNPMADPSIVGVSSGAALGAVATIAFPLAIPFGLQFAAFVGALVTAFAVYVLATENGRTPVATLLLAGVAVQTFLGAVISYTLLQSGDGLREAVFWLMGHLHASTWASVTVTIPFVAVGVGILFAYTSDLNILLMGEEDAHSLGVEVERTKRLLLAVASIVTAAAVAVSGVIGFVGLIVPHVMRLLVGPDHRILLPTSAVAGSVFLVATDTVARAGAAELPVGIVTAALGAPFFLYLLRRREVHRL